ncbi:MAG: aminopeptidase P family protein [Firmicutes bacterium]|nr:aminopeptidase P family protein [Bacillota bacterium]
MADDVVRQFRRDAQDRLRRLRQAMEAQRVDLVAVPPGPNFFYLAGFTPKPDERPSFLLLAPEAVGLLIPELNLEQCRNELSHLPEAVVASYGDDEGPQRAMQALSSRLGGPVRRLLVDDGMRADFFLLLRRTWPGGEPGLASSIINPLRMVKSPAELTLLSESAAAADQAVRAAAGACRPGATELDVAAKAQDAFRRAGAPEVLFTSIASGPNAALPHHHTGARRIAPGDGVTVDVGARRNGYCSDITRVVCAGEPSREYAEVHRIVDAAVRAALAAIKPGVPCREVDRAARAVIEEAGYGPYFVHRTGHGLGLEAHEAPSVTSTNELVLEEGMVFTVEPGIYLPGKFGIRLEEVAVVTATGVRTLSGLSRDILTV